MLRRAVLSASLLGIVLSASCGGRQSATAHDDAATAGDSAAQGRGDTGTTSERTPDADHKSEIPDYHRPNDSACLVAPPTNQCEADFYVNADGGPSVPDGGPVVGCLTDSQCTHGANGRCDSSYPWAQGCVCNYDTCAGDSDCPASELCVCHNAEPSYVPTGNACMPGNCRVDADCGAHGYCSPTVSPDGCGQIAGYYCHTAGDACVNDEDCPTVSMRGSVCLWSGADARWECGSYEICG